MQITRQVCVSVQLTIDVQPEATREMLIMKGKSRSGVESFERTIQSNRAYDILVTKFAANENGQGPTFYPA